MKVALGIDDYRRCMLFALRMWYSGSKSTLDWRRAGRRDIGDYLNDHMQGKLAELAFARILEKRGKKAEIDLEVRPGIQVTNDSDIHWIVSNGEKRKPKLKVDIKATTPRSKYLLIDAREFKNRRYDAYVLTLVNLPRDHLIRFFSRFVEFPEDLKTRILPLEEIEADFIGFAYRKDIETGGKMFKAGQSLTDPNNPSKTLVRLKVDNYGLPVAQLRRTENEWDELLNSI